jgi:2-polyprenyl-3-methyl-5-hydroxy-6-metoxy-1,4-benzoquinol methylase
LSDAQRPVYDFALGDLEREESARGRIFRAILPGARVLDVGCDTGRFGELLSRGKHAEVDGLERDPVAAEQARTRLAHVFQRSASDPGAFDGLADYDGVLFLDVLEHLVDPWEVLRRAQRVLRPGGAVHALVPNIAHVSVVRRLVGGRFDYAEFGTMDRTHLRWFTRSTIRECLEQAGLVRVEVEPVPLVPRLDVSRPWGGRLSRALTRALPDAFGGSLYATGFAPTPP